MNYSLKSWERYKYIGAVPNNCNNFKVKLIQVMNNSLKSWERYKYTGVVPFNCNNFNEINSSYVLFIKILRTI